MALAFLVGVVAGVAGLVSGLWLVVWWDERPRPVTMTSREVERAVFELKR